MKWRGRRKTILEVVLPSCLLMITTPFFAKLLLESSIMLFKPQNLSIPLSLIFFYLKLSEKYWRRLVFTQQQRRKFLCWRLDIGNKCSSLQNIMKIGLWRAGRGFYEVMKLKLIRLGQIERHMCEKREVNPHLIRPLHLQSNMEEGITLWYGVK